MAKNKFKRINKGYSEAGASYTRKAFKGFTVKSGSPNEDINYNNMTLRQRSRVLSMSGGFATSAIKTNRTNVIGCGLILKSHVDREVLGLDEETANQWQKNTEREFALWAENKNNCDAIGMNDFYKMQQLVFMNSLVNGDCFTLGQHDESAVTEIAPYSLRLNIVEADRVQTPTNNAYGGGLTVTDGKCENGNRIFDGVEVDKKGKVQAYHIRNNYAYELNAEPTEWTRVESVGKRTGLYNVIHTLCDVERPGQYRGVPLIAPVVEQILQIRRYTESELMAAVVESFFTAFIKTNTSSGEDPLEEAVTNEEPIEKDPDKEYEMGAGNFVYLEPDEDVTFGDPKRPAGGFPAFVEAIAVQIGASLEIPKEMLLKQFNSSYSASRAALLEFWKLVKMRREWFVSDWCRPVYELWMYEAVARGRIKAPGFFNDPIKRMAWLGADFIGPSQGMLDPTKEINAEQMMCENGFSTRADSAIRLNGSDYLMNVATLKVENQAIEDAKAIPKAIDLKEQYINSNVGGKSET